MSGEAEVLAELTSEEKVLFPFPHQQEAIQRIIARLVAACPACSQPKQGCANYTPLATCWSAPSSEAGRCDYCRDHPPGLEERRLINEARERAAIDANRGGPSWIIR